MTTFDPILLSRIEDAGINASAPTEQRWIDGWLVRFSATKAKRARCINAVAAGNLSTADKLALCAPVYREARLPLIVRITPFTTPKSLDAQLADLGMLEIDDTRVMVHTRVSELDAAASPQLPEGHHVVELGPAAFADLIGAWQGTPVDARAPHAQRLSHAAVPFRSIAIVDEQGAAVACGQAAVEAELVGIYGVFTAPEQRSRGHGASICRRLIADACQRGARTAYLQVDAQNESARRVYTRLGFADGYAYRYRTPPEDAH